MFERRPYRVSNDYLLESELKARRACRAEVLANNQADLKGTRGKEREIIKRAIDELTWEVNHIDAELAAIGTHLDDAAAIATLGAWAFSRGLHSFLTQSMYQEAAAQWWLDASKYTLAYGLAWRGEEAVSLSVRYEWGNKLLYSVFGLTPAGWEEYCTGQPPQPPATLAECAARLPAFREEVRATLFSTRADSTGFMHRAVANVTAEALKAVWEQVDSLLAYADMMSKEE
jgi:hypothetical protein